MHQQQQGAVCEVRGCFQQLSVCQSVEEEEESPAVCTGWSPALLKAGLYTEPVENTPLQSGHETAAVQS